MPRPDPEPTELPPWFRDFLNDRRTRKPSPHTMRAYTQDYASIAAQLGANNPAELHTDALTKTALRQAFAAYADTHSAASTRRCWSTWNVLCTFLYATDVLPGNPMSVVGQPRAPQPLPRALPRDSIAAVLHTIDQDHHNTRKDVWPQRDRALVLTGLLAGLRAAELRSLNIGSIHRGTAGATIHVTGKGNKDRAIPIKEPLLDAIDDYLASRTIRCPRTPGSNGPRWDSRQPLFVGIDGQRITTGTIESRITRAFKLACVQPKAGAMVHSLRHTYATTLAEAGVTVYDLMDLLGHSSMAASQRYVKGTAANTRNDAALNEIYSLTTQSTQAKPGDNAL